MYNVIFVPDAVTAHNEWITSLTAEQADYDSLFCLSCKLKPGVHIDPLTGIKRFIHLTGSLHNLITFQEKWLNSLY
ncbi:hypothetical protein PN823_000729 [Enterobacter hormaechei]|nr:hypothetical protein [Enterobacter hormaechei]